MATLTEARLKACQRWPYGSHAMLSLVPIQQPGLGTAAVDAHWRLYYDPQTLEAMGVEEAAGLIIHEVSHLILRHHKRAQILLRDASPETWERWNTATDYAINSMLRKQGIKLMAGVLYPEQDQLPAMLSADEYFRLLTDKAEAAKSALQEEQQEQPQGSQGEDDSPDAQQPSENAENPAEGEGESGEEGEGSGDSSEGSASAGAEGQGEGGSESPNGQSGSGTAKPDGHPGQPGGGGSCSDGQKRPWELPPPSNGGPPGMSEIEAECLIHQTAERILEKDHGQGAGAWQQVAKDILDPRVDPATIVMREVRKAVEFTSGQGDYSYRRPSRRWPCRDILRPSNVQPIPRITVIVDTSGSMDQRDLGLCLGMIAKVLHSFRIRDGIRVICGDENATVDAKTFDPKNVRLDGGGGTDMGKLIAHAAELRPTPQLILVCTDGETPWGIDPGIPVVACVTRSIASFPVPEWIKSIDISGN